MNIREYVASNYGMLLTVCKNITKNNELTDDLFQHCVTVLLEYDEEKLLPMIKNNTIKFFFIRIVVNNWSSSTSPFHKQFRERNYDYIENEFDFNITEEEYDHEIDSKAAFVRDYLDKQHWYVKKVFELKIDENMSYQQIKDLTNIPRSSLFSTFDKTRKKIKEEYNKNNNK